ncbi:MAG: hypothetical protein ACOYUZ_00580 [Patescibacteria group bacterium]
MRKTVHFTIQCPVCVGTKKIKQFSAGFGNTDGSVELDCWRCQKKGFLQEGYIRLDRLPDLHMHIQVKDAKCDICFGSGVRQDGSGKTCKACKGFRLRINSIYLDLPDGTASLYQYLTKDD